MIFCIQTIYGKHTDLRYRNIHNGNTTTEQGVTDTTARTAGLP